jgi:hypothetical protein
MKKKILSILIALAVLMSCAFVVPTTDTYASAKAKYIKVKQVTYNKMKKTITSQKKTIASQKKTITAKSNTIADQQKTIANQQNRIDQQSYAISNNARVIEEKDATIKEKKSTISWLWSTLEDYGYFYNYDTHKWEATEGTENHAPLDWVNLQETDGIIPVMEEQTELSIDNVQIIETWKAWACYYVEADGDLYVITMQRGVVDVVTQLN